MNAKKILWLGIATVLGLLTLHVAVPVPFGATAAAAKRVAAAGLVQEGVSVSCSWDIRTGPQPGATVENQRYMLSTGLGLADEGRKGLLGGGRAGGAQEFIGMVFHGLDVTHLDSLAHIFWDGKMYGGVSASMVSDRQGALVHDVLAVANGVSTRGVLLDIARLRGVDALAADDHVHPEDLEAAEQAAGVRVEPGDVVLMRTGEGGARRASGREKPSLAANARKASAGTGIRWTKTSRRNVSPRTHRRPRAGSMTCTKPPWTRQTTTK